MLPYRFKILWWMTLVFAFICLTLHFTVLFIFSMPLNPIQYTFADPIDTYTSTFFYQNFVSSLR